MVSFINDHYIILILIFVPLAVFISYYFYKQVSLSREKKIFLIVLKSLYIFLILLLFTQPVYNAISSVKSELIDIVFIDNSRSNHIPYSDITGTKQIDELINTYNFSNDRFSLFDIKGKQIQNNYIVINHYNYNTDFQSVIYETKKRFPPEYINSITIISDGSINSGSSPIDILRTFNTNIVTLGIGDTVKHKDAVLNDLIYNDKVFTGYNTIIKAVVKTVNLRNEIIKVSLYNENKIIKTESINIKNDFEIKDVEFSFTENQPGFYKYKVIIEPVTNELTSFNNYENAIIEFKPNQSNLLLLSSGPGYDNAVISRIFNRLNGYNLTLRTQKAANSFYEGSLDNLGTFNLIVLFDFPSTKTSVEGFTYIADQINKYKIPVIVFLGKQSDLNKLKQIENLLPVSLANFRSAESKINARLTSTDNTLFPDNLPELYRNTTGILQKAGSVALYIDNNSGEPIIIKYQDQKYQSMLINGFGFWKWQFTNPEYIKSLEKLFTAMIDQTIDKERDERFTIYAEKKIFDIYENPVIFGILTDETGNIISNSKITAEIKTKDRTVLTDLKFDFINNRYQLIIPVLNKDDYFIEATAITDYDNTVLKDILRIEVDSTNFEFKNTSSNFELLKEISNNNSGIFLNGINENKSEYYRFIDSLRITNAEFNKYETKRSYNLRENVWVLTIIILLFSIEWIIRKRNNIL